MKSSTAQKLSNVKDLEKDLFAYGLLVGICYQLFMVFMSLVPTVKTPIALLNVLIALVIVFIYLLVAKVGAHPLLVIAVHVLAISGFTFFWMNFGGLAGTVPSFLCVYTAFVLVCSSGWYRVGIIVSLVGLVVLYLGYPFILGMQSVWEPDKTNVLQQFLDYLIMAALIIIFLIYMKRKFIFYRNSVKQRFEQLDQIASTLSLQNQELATRQEETRAINENLEALVAQRVEEIEKRNKELAEYAFINAHMLRAPVCRIIGLISLMEKENFGDQPEKLARLKAIAHRIDNQIREINSAVS